MRVAYVCADPGVPIFGRKGSSVHAQSVAGALAGRGADVTLFAARIGGRAPAGLSGCLVHELPRPSKAESAKRERDALAANAELALALDLWGPFDLVYERYSLWSHAGMDHARAAGAAGLLEVNAPLVDEQAEHRSLIDRRGAEGVAARAFAAARALVAVSDGVAEWVAERTDAHRVHVVPNGVDPDRFPETFLPRARGTFTVGFVGTLKPWHGLATLIEAFALLHRTRPEARLLLVGDGPERGAVEADLRDRGLEGVAELTGAVDPGAVPGLLARMDVATAPYPDLGRFYFSPLKLFEYMAAGRPIVASRAGQVGELLAHGDTALLVAPGEPKELARALDCVAASPLHAARMGRRARSQALARHSWDAVADRILDLSGAPVAAGAP